MSEENSQNQNVEQKNVHKCNSPNAPWFYIRDSAGHKSVTVTLMMVSFFVTTVAYVLSLFSKIGPISIRPFDVAACSVYLVPITSLYFGRKWSDGANGITQSRDLMQMSSYPQYNPYQNQQPVYIQPPTGIVSQMGFPPDTK